MMQITAQILGYIAIALSILMFISTKRSALLLTKLISEALWFFNMLLLGLYTGASLNAINIVRSFVFFHRDSKKWAKGYLWLFLFLAATLISPVMTWAGPVSLLPAFGSVLACLGYYMRRPIMTKILNLPGIGLWLVYAILTGNTVATVSGFFQIGSLAIGLVRELISFRKNAASLQNT